MAANSRKPSVRGDPKSLKRQQKRRTTSSKYPAPNHRLAVSKKRTAMSRPNRPGMSRSSVVSSDYNPTRLAITDLTIPPESRRMVICDGENIAFNDITREYSAIRMYEAYQWFVSKGFETIVLCPDYVLNNLVGQLPSMNLVMISGISYRETNPSTNEPFEMEILSRANHTGAAIVSERSFSTTYYDYEDVVKNRVIGFTFFRNSIFIPVDPYGRAGPWLRVILCK